MRLVFDATGYVVMFSPSTPAEAPPGAPYATVDVDYPAYFVAGVRRAVEQHRVSYIAGHVCLDGTPYTPPTIRAGVTYSQALAVVAAATTVAQLREILYHVCDEFLHTGALEL